MTDHRVDSPSLDSMRTVQHEGSFEETLLALETVVEHLETGRLTLAEALLWYETGLALARRCSDLLAGAELKISTLETAYGTLGDGIGSWDDDET